MWPVWPQAPPPLRATALCWRCVCVCVCVCVRERERERNKLKLLRQKKTQVALASQEKRNVPLSLLFSQSSAIFALPSMLEILPPIEEKASTHLS